MITFEHDDEYEEAAARSYELGLEKDAELRVSMASAIGTGELTFTGAANEVHFYGQWGLVADVLKEIAGLEVLHLTIIGSHERRPKRYSWEGPDTWEVIVTHSRGCYSKYFYT